jgi:hypothetical protein
VDVDFLHLEPGDAGKWEHGLPKGIFRTVGTSFVIFGNKWKMEETST